MITRRRFIQASGGAVAMLALRGRAYAYSQSMPLQKFMQPLRGVSLPPYTSLGIPVALPDNSSVAPGVTSRLPNGLDHYSISVGQFTDQLHPSLPATKLWGYADGAHGGSGGFRHLGGVIVARRGKPVQLTFTNNLPPTHILPVDTSLPGVNQGHNRIAVHLHGGFIPWTSDGGPHDWFDPLGNHGLSFLNNTPGLYSAGPNSWNVNQAEYYWPMNLSARMLWYHDHAWGITRLNAYAGIATALIIRDPLGAEGELISQGLPGYIEAGGREIPLVIQDKIFKNAAGPQSAKYRQYETPIGDLWYPYLYETNRWKSSKGTPPQISCIPEFYGDTMLVNGTVYPTATVEPRRYRIRLLNACNARFLNLQLFVQDGSLDGITLNAAGVPTNPVGPPITIIGTEGGFLPAPVVVNQGTAAQLAFNPVTLTGNLIVAPAERFDMIVDFKGFAPGTKLILYSDTPSPFPTGSPLNDYYPGNAKNPVLPTPGFGPNTRQLMQFVVGAAVGAPDGPLNLAALTMDPAPIVPPRAGVINGVTQIPPGVPVRQLTLNEDFDAFGRLIQTMGTNLQLVKGTFGRAYTDPPTETISAGATEVWQIANLTGDTHPIHFHLVNVQIISRQPFKDSSYNGTPSFTGPAILPEPYEMGWKETVRMNPEEVTTIIAKFDLPAVPFTVPPSPRTQGHEYVYHCHILEHEEHDMMRPLVVV